ncbi:hypothetical protein BC936DRAFT_137038 [Jimgerdemannia flammicorona]|uniref:Uncharacterized protein n=1 Tax=Jimgerdemannia flammicorona TaxID=994334 RepID=A0A433CY85_9FUNG|nr:hypothetical protein BC936DRAFT_137038 [Jimgerdemannia flammicorona]
MSMTSFFVKIAILYLSLPIRRAWWFLRHVPPPEHVPNPDGINSTVLGKPFDFTRLGLRVPTIVVSPWVRKGAGEHN